MSQGRRFGKQRTTAAQRDGRGRRRRCPSHIHLPRTEEPTRTVGCGSEDDLMDCNEQESEKMGFGPWEELGAEDEDASAPVKEERLPTATPEKESRALRKTTEKKALTAREERTREQEDEKASPNEEEKPRTPKARGKRTGTLCAALLISTLLLGALTLLVSAVASRATTEQWQGQGSVNAQGNAEEGTEQIPDRIVFVKQYDDADGLLTTAELYHRCADSVVSIVAEGESVTGIGSGFFLTSDGYVATANHVIEGKSRLTVVGSDGKRHRAVVVSGNALTDLALLKIEKNDCAPVTFASSENLLVGDRVIAIGTPASLDYAGSVCSGELSYVGRMVSVYGKDGQLQKRMRLLQTDAPLNSGNSGCPLFNEYGCVIGIVTMKLGGSYEGMSFGIPSTGAQRILEAMMRGEELTEALLSGVSTTAPSLGILGEAQTEDGICGVRILDFTSDQAPVSYILKKGDLIVRIDETPVSNRSDVLAAIQGRTVGDTVAVTVLRDGQWLTVSVSLVGSADTAS